MRKTIIRQVMFIFVSGSLAIPTAHAAIALDRTRIIFDGSQKSESLSITNENKKLPYLAQGWLENEKGEKINNPLMVLPPVQRMEPGERSQLKIQGLPTVSTLPQDRESLFYFNLREIPPRANEPNVLQIALQTRIKLFYRPQAIMKSANEMETPWQQQITLIRQGDKYQVMNPTPYYITIIDASRTLKGKTAAGFEALMVAPKSQQRLKGSAAELGNSPVLTYINDYGGRPQLQFHCSGPTCKASVIEQGS
ncbi:fimbria/pilus periplasmic chaperone [Enterobacterales bacterium BIT-L3]|jgi:chaperone protein PapD|uniref:Fimbria/pilus periplasmic chaperone n=3 Tax=Enterobacteriaceae TaxID=543 RepID=A0A8K0XVW4_9ENTR|nr:fimbria/pilus periplasmic chaperone [Tenebrionibacter intestinalis]MBV5095099.1 fimbria/pilus periplasmic chaperone [Tenebrionicola larvae]